MVAWLYAVGGSAGGKGTFEFKRIDDFEGIGAPLDRRGHKSQQALEHEYFRKIKGMDLGNTTGGRADFLKLWRYALRAAKEWNPPGIMLDPEAYNDYRTYDVRFLSRIRGEGIAEVIGACKELGADMAKVVAEEYPTCVIWSLFTRFEKTLGGGNLPLLYTTPSYILLVFSNSARSTISV